MISSRHDVLSRTSRTGGQSNRRWGSKAIRIGHSLEDSSLRTRTTALSAEILLGSPKTSRSISERNSRKIRLRCIFRRTLRYEKSGLAVRRNIRKVATAAVKEVSKSVWTNVASGLGGWIAGMLMGYKWGDALVHWVRSLFNH
jgi:hypothetical protein